MNHCAYLHPKYGEKTPEQELIELQEEDGEVDLNLQEYKKQLTRPHEAISLPIRRH